MYYSVLRFVGEDGVILYSGVGMDYVTLYSSVGVIVVTCTLFSCI